MRFNMQKKKEMQDKALFRFKRRSKIDRYKVSYLSSKLKWICKLFDDNYVSIWKLIKTIALKNNFFAY